MMIKDHVSRYFTLNDYCINNNFYYFFTSDYDAGDFRRLIQDLGEVGYVPFIKKQGKEYRIEVVEKSEPKKSRLHINILLFFATILTTIYAGYSFEGNIIEGIAFSIAIMGIIGTHETAHYLAARKHAIKATLPYFIPAPTLIGTFGAVISVKSPIPNKNALFDLGFSGPIAGIIVTIPVLIIGVYLSKIVPMQETSIMFIPSILMYIIIYFMVPVVPDGYILQIHPLAFAGWVGTVVTMLNLMPVAFLDGGHISRSIFSEKIHKIISIIGIIITFALGWIPMAILMILILFMTKRHPGALDDVSKLSKYRKMLVIAIIIIFIVCLSPIPIISI